MRDYRIYVNGVDVGTVDSEEVAYEAYSKAVELADTLFCGSAMLVDNSTGEVIAYHEWGEDD